MDSLYSTCGKRPTAKAELHACNKCGKYYHIPCTSFEIVLDAHNDKITICNFCLVNINTPTSSRNSSLPSMPVAGNTRSRNNSTKKFTPVWSKAGDSLTRDLGRLPIYPWRGIGRWRTQVMHRRTILLTWVFFDDWENGTFRVATRVDWIYCVS